MTAKAIAAVLALGAIAIFALPGGAAADGPHSRGLKIKREVAESAYLRGTNGFTVGVKLRDRRTLELITENLAEGLGAVEATYVVPYRQPRGSNEIKATIGGLGLIDVRFVPESEEEVPPLTECQGGKTVTEEGMFVGLISFRGEGGYTRVRAHHAFGTITKSPELTCNFNANPKREKATEGAGEKAGAGSEPELESEAVGLKATADHGRVDFKADRLRFKAKKRATALIVFEATATRQFGAIKETSTAFDVFASGKTFLSPDPRRPTSEAVIHPDSPFSGSATFRRPPEGKPTWTGDLKVEMPGLGLVHLAGPGTHAAMCESTQCRWK